MLWIRFLDSLEARPVAGTESAMIGPFWSPDSRFIAFAVAGTPSKLKKVEVTGGAPQTLCDLSDLVRRRVERGGDHPLQRGAQRCVAGAGRRGRSGNLQLRRSTLLAERY